MTAITTPRRKKKGVVAWLNKESTAGYMLSLIHISEPTRQ